MNRPAAEGDPEYSATVLASHWIQGPDPDAARTDPDATRPVPTLPSGVPPAEPDRTEGTVLRFGPGVTAAVARRTHRTLGAHRTQGAQGALWPQGADRTDRSLPVVPASQAASRRRGWRRHALPALVLVAVLAFLAWHRLGPSVAVREATVAVTPTVLGCDATADITARVITDGRPGTLTYRWVRSDGTDSEVLEEEVTRGQREARLRLLWTFEGRGRYPARAELRILTPDSRTASVGFAYDCR